MEALRLESGVELELSSLRRVWLDFDKEYELWCEIADGKGPLVYSAPGQPNALHVPPAEVKRTVVIRRFKPDQPYAAAAALRDLRQLIRRVRDEVRVWAEWRLSSGSSGIC